jgi:basic membrane lipoprotein Med (substrate-binding protein (PBP1-ABC) superfamily)
MNRFCLLLFAGLVAIAAIFTSCTPKAAPTAEPLKIGFVYSGPVGDVGWTHHTISAARWSERNSARA